MTKKDQVHFRTSVMERIEIDNCAKTLGFADTAKYMMFLHKNFGIPIYKQLEESLGPNIGDRKSLIDKLLTCTDCGKRMPTLSANCPNCGK